MSLFDFFPCWKIKSHSEKRKHPPRTVTCVTFFHAFIVFDGRSFTSYQTRISPPFKKPTSAALHYWCSQMIKMEVRAECRTAVNPDGCISFTTQTWHSAALNGWQNMCVCVCVCVCVKYFSIDKPATLKWFIDEIFGFTSVSFVCAWVSGRTIINT